MKDIVQGPLKNFLNFPNKLQASDGAKPSNNGAVEKIPYQGSWEPHFVSPHTESQLRVRDRGSSGDKVSKD